MSSLSNKLIISLFVCLFILTAIVEPVWAKSDDELRCNSLHAVYKPHPLPEDDHPYRYQMTIEKTGKIRAGEPWYQFVIETLDKNEKTVLSRFKTEHVCSVNGVGKCHIGLTKGRNFDVMALNRDLTQNHSRLNGKGNIITAYLFIFPNFSRSVRYMYLEHEDAPDMEYLTEEKAPLAAVDIWRLSKCKNSNE